MTHAMAEALLARWQLQGARITPLTGGLINQTFLIEATARKLVLQRLHPVFRGEVNLDIDAVTRHLETKGLITPRIVPTLDGALWVELPDGVWRMQTFVPGRSLTELATPALVRAAGEGVGRFHVALLDLRHTFHFTRQGAHDTRRHLSHLHAVLGGHREHPLYAHVQPTAEAILSHGEGLPEFGDLPRRIIHGDLKCANLRFAADREEVIALLDLDTLAHDHLGIEMGDALRSWCNPLGESAPAAAVDEALFGAAIDGYAAITRAHLSEVEQAALVPGLEIIALELSARFCADAIEERYFGWDATRYSRRGEHNLVRAQSQLSLAQSVRAARPRLQARVAAGFR